MMHPKEITVMEMGAIAHTKLAQEREASVMGITSHGTFLLLASGWVVFLSPDVYRGPLTLNYKGGPDDFGFLKTGSPARVHPDHIFFPESSLAIHTGQAKTWHAPPLHRDTLPPSQRLSQMALVARQLLARGQASDFGVLIPDMLGDMGASKAQETPVYPLMERLQNSLHEGKLTAIVEGMQAILGMGGGLTPSGDDVVTGYLLTLTRWGHALAPDLEIKALARDILQGAYRKTTTLSANLIECASLGQANERLILALDGILSGNTDAPTCARYLAGWGNTSGVDALAGMALALSAGNKFAKRSKNYGSHP
jgi:hypothetical protein